MLLAAGLGTRMRPITDSMPKPLVPVAGKPLIDYALDALAAAGVGHVVVNVHYLADQMRRHLAGVKTPAVVVSDETDALLDSGGGIVKALPLLGGEPFYVLNADTFWIEDRAAARGNLEMLAAAFDPQAMDILVMVAALPQTTGHTGRGDFVMGGYGRLARFDGSNGTPLVYAGALICHPRIFDGAPAGPFSLNRCFDSAIAAGRLDGMAMHGHWLTVGTPEAIGEAEAAIAAFDAPLTAG